MHTWNWIKEQPHTHAYLELDKGAVIDVIFDDLAGGL
jgi:hypothetical protein